MYYINKYEDKHSLDAFIQYLRNIKRIGWAFALVAMSFRQTANVWYIEIKKKNTEVDTDIQLSSPTRKFSLFYLSLFPLRIQLFIYLFIFFPFVFLLNLFLPSSLKVISSTPRVVHAGTLSNLQAATACLSSYLQVVQWTSVAEAMQRGRARYRD